MYLYFSPPTFFSYNSLGQGILVKVVAECRDVLEKENIWIGEEIKKNYQSVSNFSADA